MTPYEQGYFNALEKIGVSRWREAIYSGELPLNQAEALKQRMGVTPAKEMSGIERGARNIAKHHGYTTHEYTLKKLWDAIKKGKITPDKLKGAFPRAVTSLSFGGAMTNPATKEIVHIPAVTKGLFTALTPSGSRSLSALEGIGSLVKGHEASEAAAMGRKGFTDNYIVPSPVASKRVGSIGKSMHISQKMQSLANRLGVSVPQFSTSELANLISQSPQSGLVGGVHADPSVVLKEIRQSRMLSPRVQRTIEGVRSTTGEFPQLRIATGHHPGRPYIPKRKIRELAQRMRGVSANQLEGVERMLVREAQKPLLGEGLLRKGLGLLRRIK